MACLPFRYNIEDEKTIEPREIILDVKLEDSNYESIKQQVLNFLDKEKQEYGKLNAGYSGDLSSVITIE